jgi:myo-inositol-1(or 4)-monophosphatase
VPKTTHPDFEEQLAFAHRLADAAGASIMPYFRCPIEVQNKDKGAGFDPVTAADRAAEIAIAALIATERPGHGIVGEEFGNRNEQAQNRWVIDPIDGTRAFIMGSPLWGTLIGLLDRHCAALGIMDQPYTRERFWSGKDATYFRGATGETRQVRTRSCGRIEDATFTTTHPDLFVPGVEVEAFQRLKSSARMTRYGGDCYAYCLLASGFIDVIIETGLKSYDVVALIPIVERAGGVITTWEGHAATSGGRIVATGDPRLHDAVLKMLAA